MALESASFISGLVAANPTASDPVKQGDDHLRLIKSVLKNTFPNLNAAVTPSPTEMNYLAGVTSAIQGQLDAKAAAARTISAGTGLTGGGDLSANRTISHADTSTQASVDNSGASVIQDVTLDDFGHVTALGSVALTPAIIGAIANGGAAFTGGYTTTADDDGTPVTTYTPTPTGGNLKRIINGGALTFAAPSASGDYTLIVQVTNNATAGAITMSGFNKVTGDSFTTTDGHDFMVYITKINGFTHANVVALQ